MDDSRNPRRETIPGSGQVLRLRKTGAADPAPADPGEAPLDGAPGALSTGDLFDVLWRELAEVLGTAAAATLLRRAAQRALPRWPELATLSITRESLDYRYTVPAAWREPVSTTPPPGPPAALCAVARELWPLLVELTGSVVVNLLADVPELRDRGIVPAREER